MTSFIEDFHIIVHPDYLVEDVALDDLSQSKCIHTNSGAFVFNGELDIKLFEAVLAISIRHCPWLVCELVVQDSGAVTVSPRRQDDPHPSPAFPGYLRCEIDDRSHLPFASTLPYLFPVHVPENMLRKDLALPEVDGVPICALRISQFQKHFLLSYRMNAAHYDQKSVIYFFTFLSSLYMHNGRAKVHPPIFLPCAHLLHGKRHLASSSLSTVTGRTSTDSLSTLSGHPAVHREETHPSSYRSVGLAHKLSLSTDDEKIAEWKLQSRDIAISTNDLLHAVFIKALAAFQVSKRAVSDSVVLKYARDIRPVLGVGAEIVGDYVKYESWQLSTQAVMEMSLLELAIANRQFVSGFFVDDDPHPTRQLFPGSNSSNNRNSGSNHSSNNSSGSSVQMNSNSGSNSEAGYSGLSESSSGSTNSKKGAVTDLNVLMVRNFWSHFPYDDILFRTARVQSLLLEDTKRMTNDDNHCGEVCVSFRTCGVDVEDETRSGRRELVVDVFSLYPALLEQLRMVAETSGLFRYH